LHTLLVILAVGTMAPFLWLVCASVKQGKDVFSAAFLPWGRLHDLTLNNFRALFAEQPFARWLVNSAFVSSTYTVLVVTLSSLGGFSLAKYRFAGKRPLMLFMLATMLLPGQVLLPASYELMYQFG